MPTMPDPNSISNDFQFETLFDQFDEQWKQGNRPAIDEFMKQVDANDLDQVARELIAIDIEYRRKNSEEISADDYSEFHPKAIEFARHCLVDNDTLIESNERTITETIENIGPYHLLEVIGQGGMGTVWKAQQHQPIERTLAIKLIKPGLGSKEIIARFESERRALAMMDHPSIAKIHEAGTTSENRPYFAMEWVDGLPVTDFCSEHVLNIKQKLQLFVTICEAVQHAHQKGIIHRDLKPSNILVAQSGDRLLPKVIDFGLSKPFDDSLRAPDSESFTSFGQVLGSVKYMSPEQASFDKIDVDTRADIYSLGAILYELLTGSTPLDDDVFAGKSLGKTLEIIRETDPLVPSKQLTFNQSNRPKTPGDGKPDSSGLAKVVSGDLDWIVMKALSKEANRRYSSASEFAADINRYLNVEPVIARPPSTRYLLGKFVRKNKTWVSAASLVAIAMVLGTIAAIWGMVSANVARNDAIIAQQSEQKRAEAEQRAKEKANKRTLLAFDAIQKYYAGINEQLMLQEPLFQKDQRLQAIQKSLLGAPLQFYEQLESDLANDPDPVAQFLLTKAYHELAAIQERLGRDFAAKQTLEKSIKILNALVKQYPDKTEYLGQLIEARDLMFHQLSSLDPDSKDAMQNLKGTIVLLDEILLRQPDNQLYLSIKLGHAIQLCVHEPNNREQQRYMELAMENAAKIDGALITNDHVLSVAATNLSDLAFYMSSDIIQNLRPNSLAEALPIINKSIALSKKIVEPDYIEEINVSERYDRRAIIYRKLGKDQLALNDQVLALQTVEKSIEAHPNMVDALFIAGKASYSIAKRFDEQNQTDQCKSNLTKSINYLQKVRQQAPEFYAATTMMNVATEHYGDICLVEGKFDEALAHYQIYEPSAAPDFHSTRPSVAIKIGLTHAKLGDVDKALVAVDSVDEHASVIDRVMAAQVLANCCLKTREQSDLAEDDKSKRVKEYQSRAMRFLDVPQLAQSPDFINFFRVENDWRAFDEVPEFQKLLGHSAESID